VLAWGQGQLAVRSQVRGAAALQSPPLLPTLLARYGAGRAKQLQTPVKPGRAELPRARRPLLNRRRGRSE
jgi:hypothetical protein